MELKNLLVDMSDGVAVLTINNPRTMNALNGEVLGELDHALRHLDMDPAVRGVIITGAGGKAFVAGADIKEMAAMNALEGHLFARAGQRVMLLLEKMTKPVIAAVNGYALGGGLELALGCDFIYAADTARFGFPEVTLGIIPGFGGTQNLARLIGPNRAAELIFTGRMITAEKALAWGIVNEVVVPDELLAKAMDTAKVIAKAGPLAVAYAKDAMTNGLNMGKDEGFGYEASLFGVLFDTEDRREGMGAFVEKRSAVFKGV
jgi:enoyl-CoA hydratase